MPAIGIIGGSGLYKVQDSKDAKWVKVDTPFGKPSDEYLITEFSGIEVAFLPRHGRGHYILPSELNYLANIYGMKKLGVEIIISVSAVGSLKEAIRPLDILIPDQFVDRTNQARKATFFGNGVVAHIQFADPVCPVVSKALYDAGISQGITMHRKGTYLNMEGPAFSTRAESNLYRSWGMDVIGMTNMPEAKCAREAEICYATLAMVTDYDCWHMEEVTIDMVIQNLLKNVDSAKKILTQAIPKLPKTMACRCAKALKDAIITQQELIPETTRKNLDLIIGKYIK